MNNSIETSAVNVGTAIRSLRDKIGETQEGMARLLGCTLSGFRKWESGVSLPGGGFLIRMLQMCPDAASLASFGVEDKYSTTKKTRPPQDGYYKLREDLEKVIASGQSNLIGQAEEVLDRLAEDAQHMTRKNRSKK